EHIRNKLISTATLLVLIFAILIFFVIIIYNNFFQLILFTENHRQGIYLLPILILLTTESTILITVLKAERRTKRYLIVTLTQSISFILIFLAGLAMGFGLSAFFTAYIISEISVYTLTGEMIKKAMPAGFDTGLLGKLLKIGLPLMGVAIANLLLYQADHYLIKTMINVESTGIYNYGYKFAAVPGMFVVLINNVWMPRLFEKGDSYDRDLIKEFSTLVITFCTGIYLLLVAVFKYGGSLLIPPGFEQSFQILIIAGFGYLFYSHVQILDTLLILRKKTLYLFIISLVSLVINIILNLALIPKYGMPSAAAVTTFSFFISWILILLYLGIYEKKLFSYGMAIEFLIVIIPAVTFMLFTSLQISVLLYVPVFIFVILRNKLFRSLISSIKVSSDDI
ncbi:MAG: lipopolysaccharide biosynthesis protein, partial [Calditrichaceae bacterium]